MKKILLLLPLLAATQLSAVGFRGNDSNGNSNSYGNSSGYSDNGYNNPYGDYSGSQHSYNSPSSGYYQGQPSGYYQGHPQGAPQGGQYYIEIDTQGQGTPPPGYGQQGHPGWRAVSPQGTPTSGPYGQPMNMSGHPMDGQPVDAYGQPAYGQPAYGQPMNTPVQPVGMTGDNKFPQDRAATPKDQEINKKIRDKIAGWFSDNYKMIILRTQNGVVVIEGTVLHDEDQKNLNEQIKGIDGVKEIYNRTQVKK
jgi:hypothetical protein